MQYAMDGNKTANCKVTPVSQSCSKNWRSPCSTKFAENALKKAIKRRRATIYATLQCPLGGLHLHCSPPSSRIQGCRWSKLGFTSAHLSCKDAREIGNEFECGRRQFTIASRSLRSAIAYTRYDADY